MNPITITPIEGSSQIHGIGYDAGSQTLAVQFHKRAKGQPNTPGAVYHYDGVPIDKFNAFTKADSKGTFFGKRIRNQYPTTKQEEAK